MKFLDVLDKFAKGLQDFGDTMQKIQKEFSEDEVLRKQNAKHRESIDKENLKKIWGDK
ncbi:hypothetical protein [Nitrosopumilus sp. S6]